MANPILDALTAQVASTVDVEQSAVTLILGISARIDAAVAAALAGGATAAELAPVADLSAALKTSADSLSNAITANTPAAP